MKWHSRDKRKEKAQITLMLIAGLLIVSAVVLSIYIVQSQSKTAQERLLAKVPVELRPLYNYMSDCMSKTAINGIYLVSIQGGYFNLPEGSLEADYGSTAFWYEFGKGMTAPSKATVESELSKYLDTYLPGCVNYSQMELESGMTITPSNSTTSATITAKEVVFDVRYPVDIKVKGSDERIEEFQIRVPCRLSYLLNISDILTEKIENEPDWVDFTTILDFDVTPVIIPVNESVLVYSFIDNKSMMRTADPLIFMLASRTSVNHAPVLNIPLKLVGADNERFIYTIPATDADGGKLKFYSDNVLFPVSEDGKVDFIPRITGSYRIKVTVEDPRGARDTDEFEWLVLE